MEKIENYEWLKNRINEFRTAGSHSNFFFLPQKIQAMIDEDKLFFQKSEKNLFLFEREPEFYRMYYFLGDMETVPQLEIDLPVVIEFPYRETYSNAQNIEVEYIKKLGFEIGRRSRIMSVKSPDVVLPMQEDTQNINIKFADTEECEQIISLLDSSFNKFFSFLPDKAELLHLIDDKSILTIYYNNILAGVIDVEIRGKSNWIWHFAVDSKYRHKGLAKKLLSYVFRMYKEDVNDFMLWVDVDNIPAVNLYKQAGYTFSAKGADEYILNCKGETEV